jgi:hypothetical protein
VPVSETGLAVRAGLIGAAAELAAGVQLERGLALVSEPYRTGRAGNLLKASRAVPTAAAGPSLLAHRNRAAGALSGAAHLATGLCTRFGVYNAVSSRLRTRSTSSSRSANAWRARSTSVRVGGRRYRGTRCPAL